MSREHQHHPGSPHRSGGGGCGHSAALAEPDLFTSQLELLDLEAAGWLGFDPACETGWSCCRGEAGSWAQRWLNCPDCGKPRGLVLACDTCHGWVTQPDVWVECSDCSELYEAADLLIHWERI